MLIMQTADAAARRSYLEEKGLAKVIFSHEGDDFVCVQYHPKGMKGADPCTAYCIGHHQLTGLYRRHDAGT
jgi:hypothetical protein